MTGQLVNPVPAHGEHAQYPLHNCRKTCTIDRLDDNVKVISHDAKILDTKIVLLFGSGHCFQKQVFHGGGFHYHLFPIGTGCHMVAPAIA